MYAVFKATDSSTKGLHTHLQTKHQINISKRHMSCREGNDAASTTAASASSSRSAKTSGSSSKYVFFDQADRSLPATIAHMTIWRGQPTLQPFMSLHAQSFIGS